MKDLVEQVVLIAKKAGDEILDVYQSDDFGESKKSDQSPLTKADKAANDAIVKGLSETSDLPIVSEENEIREINGKKFWLVDPLDGTKEFIKRNGEFTVNIALIDNGEPVLGVVHAPVLNVFYIGSEHGAFKIDNNKKTKINAKFKDKKIKVVASRSHLNEATNKFLEQINDYELISMGSSLKLCLVAEGKAAIYPRLAPTCLWDTAAADAVVRAAGGSVRDENGKTLSYRLTKDMLNPFFIVLAKNSNYLGIQNNAH